MPENASLPDDLLKSAPVVLLTSSTCHACLAAKPLVAEVAEEFGVESVEVSVDAHPELLKRFGPEIPVLVVDGVPRDFWVIDPVRFRRIMTERRGEA
jgi:thiol-disulfide isomerase/thioredoxin